MYIFKNHIKMGLFKKKDKEKELKELSELPKLQKLPRLSDDPEFDGVPFKEKTLPELPKYSINTIDNGFSKNTFKKTIFGKEEERFGADEFAREQMMPEQEIKPIRPEFPYKMERPQKDLELRSWQEPKTKKSGQVFIKIDKFEESLKIFEQTKNKIIEMERTLEDIKKLKEKEEKELSYWMAEIQTIKNQTEKVEKDIFSKLE